VSKLSQLSIDFADDLELAEQKREETKKELEATLAELNDL